MFLPDTWLKPIASRIALASAMHAARAARGADHYTIRNWDELTALANECRGALARTPFKPPKVDSDAWLSIEFR